MSNVYDVAVVGATGAVGEPMIALHEERHFPVRNLYPLASSRSAGKTVTFQGSQVKITDLADFDFSRAQIGLFSAGGSISAEFAPKAAAAGCVVVDNTSHFRQEEDIPLIVPEVNIEALAGYTRRNIIANPNCSTIQMLVALKPIYDAVGIERINVATYQAVSGTGKEAIEELAGQTARLLNGQEIECSVYPRQIAFNCLPHIDTFQENGYTREEMKMVWETRKIFGDEGIQVNPTCVRIPVFYGHSEAVHIETVDKITAAEARGVRARAPGGTGVYDRADGGDTTAVAHSAGKDPGLGGRIREGISHTRGLDMWVVSANLRTGAAQNSVHIAESLVATYRD